MVDSSSLHVDRQYRVAVLRGAFSYLPFYNLLNNAYHDADMYWCAPPYGLRWQIPAILAPNRVLLLVDADSLVDDIREKLRAARVLVEQMKPTLDREIERPVYHSPDRPYDNLPANLVVVDQSAVEGYGSARIYTFNAYRLAIATLDEYEHFIEEVMKSHKVPFTQVSLICQKAKLLDNRVGLVVQAM